MNHIACFRPPEPTEIECVSCENLTRRRFLIGVGGVIGATVLSGCGVPGAPTPTATVAATRQVRHAFGETEIPAVPQRVVSLDAGTLAYLLELGIVPIASGTYEPGFFGEGRDFHPLLDSYGVEDKVEPFLRGQPDLERLTALDPDLIIGTEQFVEESGGYNILSGIAPTVAYPRPSESTFRDEFRAVAELLGKTDQAAALLAELDRGIAALAERVSLPFSTASVVRPFDDGNFDLFTKSSTPGGFIATALGLTLVPDIDPRTSDRGQGRVALSAERVGDLQGELLIILARPKESAYDAAGVKVLQDNPLYPLLPAVQAGRVAFADNIVLFGGTGTQSILTELKRLADTVQQMT